MNGIFIEAESFKNLGGWVIDTQSMETLHSSYVMAHGMGIPVLDAVTDFEVEESGQYNVWVLTRDWTAVWDAPESAGKFKIKVDGTELESTLGTNGAEWAWQKAGTVCLESGKHTLSLCDKTGFNARCDAVFLTTSQTVPSSSRSDIDDMRRRYNWKEIKDCEQEFDLVVVGGGIAGICTALTAVRNGVSTALINDRSILGGCNSSEVRVGMGGETHLEPYTNLGNVVREIAPVMGDPKIYDKRYFEDDRKMFAFEILEGRSAGHKIFLNESVTDVEAENGVITAVICTNTVTGKKTRIKAKLFSDCSGDGVVARKIGCETMYGREAESVFGESLAPSEHQNLVMGHSIRWYTEEKSEAVPFPDIDWGLKFDDDSCLNCTSGDWEQETGFSRNMVSEIEYIRDYGLRAIYSNWAYQKHHFKDKERFANLSLKWVSAVGGKREGYRVVGDYVLTQSDLEDKVYHEDESASINWSIDMHFPEPTNLKEFGEAFRSFAYHRGIDRPYPVPYRCLYARDAENLFIGGRLVSSSHVAFSAIRVMRTLGQLGEVVGLASSVCKKHGCTPREVYTEHLDELKLLMKEGVKIPDSFGCPAGSDESYHFKDIGWWWLHRKECEKPSEVEKFKKGVEFLGLSHKNPMPDEWK
ncbi:MAG: FAD-dependent oxidoreductase [Oscillospiraceae bacterium]|nr:FAD-dependent oxidoreductase [Oscillospiraceae bacterium]